MFMIDYLCVTIWDIFHNINKVVLFGLVDNLSVFSYLFWDDSNITLMKYWLFNCYFILFYFMNFIEILLIYYDLR